VRKLQLLKAGIVLIYASNIHRKLSIFFSFQKCNQSSQIVYLLLWHIAMAVSRADSFRQVSLIFSMI